LSYIDTHRTLVCAEGKKLFEVMDEQRRKNLEYFLNVAVADCDTDARRAVDPVGIVWSYDTDADREIAALIVSCLAYGQVDLVRRAAGDALARMGDSPRRFVEETPRSALPGPFEGFVYRMTRGADLADLVAGIAAMIAEHGSLAAGYAAQPGGHHERASAFVRKLRAGRLRVDCARGLRYLLVDPADGSAAKRLHLFFRWVARGPDDVDLGIWDEPEASELVMPLDTHTSRLCRYLGLTERKSADGKAARQVTESLRLLDPDDPLRFDFALAHLGISGRCIHRRSPEHCPNCPIERVCTL